MNTEQKTRTLVIRKQGKGQLGWYGLATFKLTRLAAGLLFISRLLTLGLAGAFLIGSASAQNPAATASGEQKAKCDNQIRSTYLLGPDDQLEITGPELTDLSNKPVRIDGEGDIQVPLAGTVHVAGMTVQQTEQELDKVLTKYIRQPQVVVNVAEVRSQPVSVLGAVNSPGVHQVQGHKTVLEMLAMAGGIRQDAGYSIRITRQLEWGCIPLPGAQLDASGKYSVAEVNLRKIMDAKTPEENIQIFPHDVISVPKAEMVYVIGEVKRSGGFVLGEHQSISVLQALSMAEGLNTGADPRHAKILRLKADADQRVEVAVDVKDALNGKKPDMPLQGEDILFIPGSTGKKAALRGLEAAIQTGTGLAIWRMP
jgi:polysaccharide export outer membrane protein